MKTIADKVNARMTELNISEDDVSLRMGRLISQVAVHKIRVGKTKRSRYLPELEAALEMNQGELLGRHELVSHTAPEANNTIKEPPPHDFTSLMNVASPNTYAALERLQLAFQHGKLSRADLDLIDAIERRLSSDQDRQDS